MSLGEEYIEHEDLETTVGHGAVPVRGGVRDERQRERGGGT